MRVFYEKIPVDNFFSDYTVTVTGVQYEQLSAHDLSLVPENTPSELHVEVTSAYERSKPFALLTFVPVIRTSASQCSRVVSLTVSIEGRNPLTAKSAKSYTNRSVLASGQWYKFSLTQTGIYKVTYNDLKAMGMSSPIVSSQIALFGNGGKMLPESNSVPRTDDLRELPVMMMDGGDNSFDAGDYFVFFGESPHTVYMIPPPDDSPTSTMSIPTPPTISSPAPRALGRKNVSRRWTTPPCRPTRPATITRTSTSTMLTSIILAVPARTGSATCSMSPPNGHTPSKCLVRSNRSRVFPWPLPVLPTATHR